MGRPPTRGNRPPRRARRRTRHRRRGGVPPGMGSEPRRRGSPSGVGVAAPILGYRGCGGLRGVRGSSGAPARRGHRGPRRYPLTVSLQPEAIWYPMASGVVTTRNCWAAAERGDGDPLRTAPAPRVTQARVSTREATIGSP